MKTYGEKRDDTIKGEKWTSDRCGGWTGRQSRKVARRRRKDKKIMHRLARRVGRLKIDDWTTKEN